MVGNWCHIPTLCYGGNMTGGNMLGNHDDDDDVFDDNDDSDYGLPSIFPPVIFPLGGNLS